MSARRETGNTLIELLAATVILGVISFALTESVISGFRNTGATEDRLVGSLDRQRVAAAFVPDVQSAQAGAAGFDQGVPCGETPADPENVLINLRWTDGFDRNVASYLKAVIDGKTKLVRRYCTNDEQVDDDEVLAEIVALGSVVLVPPNPPTDSLFLLKVCPPEPPETDPPCPEPTYEVAASRRSQP